MKLVLPPKRFESLDNPRYDPLRPRKWFPLLEKRKWQLPALKQAHYQLLAYSDRNRKQVAEEYGVDERELRDYINFVTDKPGNGQKPGFLPVLDDAWEKYTQDMGRKHISLYIAKEAPFWGIKPRHVIEAWEVDGTFWPTGYLNLWPKIKTS